MSAIHPARIMPFRELRDGLRAAREARLVLEQTGSDGLSLFCYSQSCVFDGQWNDVTLIARGLILDMKQETVVATPFPKFFNVGGGKTSGERPLGTASRHDLSGRGGLFRQPHRRALRRGGADPARSI